LLRRRKKGVDARDKRGHDDGDLAQEEAQGLTKAAAALTAAAGSLNLCGKLPEREHKLETPMKTKALAIAGIATVAVYAVPAVAHHSFAMFDAAKTVVLQGAVKEFQWTNPHAWILLNVANPQGQAEQWAIELNGPSGLVRDGWKPKTLTPGMPVEVTIHPLHDGTNGGQFMTVKLPDGSTMGRGGIQQAPPPAERPPAP